MIVSRVVADPDDADPLEARRLQMLGRLVPGVVHELANPLLVLGGTVEFLLDEPASGPRTRERLEVVESAAAEIAEIVKALQHLARERAQPEATLPLGSFVEDTASLARRFSGVRDVELVVRVSGSAAIDARPGALRVSILAPLLDALATAAAGSRVELVVEDGTVRLDGAELPLPP
jgi:signal transduction histidine kinase